MTDLERLLNLMFDPDQRCCPSDSKFGYHSIPVSELSTGKVTLVSPNPSVAIKTVEVKDLTLLAINPMKEGFRNDENVSEFRTFLWEIDTGSLASQFEYVTSLKLPYSAAIFSGNKSIHFLTVLDTAMDEKTYRTSYQWALNIGTLFDPICKNPSRSVRMPGSIRLDTGKEQKLLRLNNKIKLQDFIDWLNRHPNSRPKERESRKDLTNDSDYGRLSSWAKSQFRNGIDFSKGRNRAYFSLACDLFQSGHDEDTATAILLSNFTEEHDFKEKELLTTINSAFKYMEHKK